MKLEPSVIRRRAWSSSILAMVLLSLVVPVQAQDYSRASVSLPDLSAFPTLSADLDVHNTDGSFTAGLQLNEITVLEDDKPRPVSQLSLSEPGVRLLVTLNLGPALALKDSAGIARFEQISKALKTWASRATANNLDTFDLVIPQGLQGANLASPGDWLASFNNYHPDLAKATPSLESLGQAISLSGDPTARPGMEKAILYITPLPERELVAALPDLTDRALQSGVHIFIWLIGATQADMASSDPAKQLAKLANQTGGEVFAYSGIGAFPDIETYLKPLRSIYHFSYTSGITQNGNHSLVVTIRKGTLVLSTQARFFKLAVAPPNPMFNAPPSEILRTTLEASASSDILTPLQYSIAILVEFPDGYARTLSYSRLFVDGVQVAENTQEPFYLFAWNLSGYQTSQKHILRAEVQDSLGLTAASIDLPVQVNVATPPDTMLHWILQYRLLISAVGGLAAVIVIILGGAFYFRKRMQLSPTTGRPRQVTPKVSRPVFAALQQVKQPAKRPEIQPAPQIKILSGPCSGTAQLIWLTDDHHPLPVDPILLPGREVTLGCDPARATCLVEAPSIAPLHARLRQMENGAYLLFDEGSTAGTWINYTPVKPEGSQVMCGDVIHMGRIPFRMQHDSQTSQRIPKITPVREKP